jgi:hypothetical protein
MEETNNENPDYYPADPECAVTEWTTWSECSKPCGKGVKTRSRKYKNKGARKKCAHLPNAPELQQTIECEEDDCSGDITSPLKSALTKRECRMTDWSEWTPCSVTCGLGRKMRTRMPINKGIVDAQRHHERFLKRAIAMRAAYRSNYNEFGESEEDKDNELDINDPDDPCYGVDTVEEVVCGHDLPICESSLYSVPGNLGKF